MLRSAARSSSAYRSLRAHRVPSIQRALSTTAADAPRAVLWHNPECSKSRKALALLDDAKAQYAIREYLVEQPKLEELQELERKLKLPPAECARDLFIPFAELERELKLPPAECARHLSRAPCL